MSGNARLVEQLKTAYNTKFDADIEAVGDVMAVAGLLKCFLRELPEGVVPEEQTKVLVQIQQGQNWECHIYEAAAYCCHYTDHFSIIYRYMYIVHVIHVVLVNI